MKESDKSGFFSRAGVFLRWLLESRYLPIVLAVLGFAISMPALKVGFATDDYVHRAAVIDADRLPRELVENYGVSDEAGSLSFALMNQFSFFREGDAADSKEAGVLAWWANEDMRAAFWRPVTSLTHWIDYRLFPDRPGPMHVHSLLWFSAVIFLILLFYRQIIGPVWIAGFTAVLYLLDENGYMPVTLVAARNALVALAFGLVAMLCHHKWRQEKSLPFAVLSLVCFALSLLSAEAGLATFAYLFAYAVVLDEGNLRKRLVSLMPAVVLIIVWRLVYNVLGYGVYGLGVYVDPVNEPLVFIKAVLFRWPVLLMGQLSWQGADLLLIFSDSMKLKVWLASVVFLTLMFVILWPLLRQNRLARFFGLGMVLSALPFCATMASNRNLLFCGIGGMGLVVVFAQWFFTQKQLLPGLRLWRVGAWVLCAILLFVHVPFAAASRVFSVRTTRMFVSWLDSTMDLGPAEENRDKDVVVVDSQAPLFTGFAPLLNAYRGEAVPRRIRILAPSLGPIEITRGTERSLSMKAKRSNLMRYCGPADIQGAYLITALTDILRPERKPLKTGDKFELGGFSAEVLAVNENGYVSEVAFEFDVELEDEQFRWLTYCWNCEKYHEFELPEVGETVELAGPPEVTIKEVLEHMRQMMSGRKQKEAAQG